MLTTENFAQSWSPYGSSSSNLFSTYEEALDYYYHLVQSQVGLYDNTKDGHHNAIINNHPILDMNLRGFLIVDYQKETSQPYVFHDIPCKRTAPIRIVEEHLYRDYLVGYMTRSQVIALHQAIKRRGIINRYIFSYAAVTSSKPPVVNIPSLHKASMISMQPLAQNSAKDVNGTATNNPYKAFPGYRIEPGSHLSHYYAQEILMRLFPRQSSFIRDLYSVIIADEYYSGNGAMYYELLELMNTM